MRLAVILLLIGTTAYSQSAFRFIGKAKKLKVERVITVRKIHENLARKVLRAEKLDYVQVRGSITLRATHRETVRPPSRVVGPNNYLKGINRRFKGIKGWDKVNQADGYNGAHHIVTKFVIREIGGSEEAIRNGPSVFHPLHNRTEYIDWFHNHQRQLEIYRDRGIKGIIEDFFERVDGFSSEEKEQLMLEAELWAKHWGLRWE